MSLDLHVVLFEPEIPQNTGNIARTCACTGATLHLVEPMGFRATQRNLARAGLDYWDKVRIVRHASVEQFLEQHADKNLYFFTGKANHNYCDVSYEGEVYLIFGRESRGIDEDVLEAYQDNCVRIPMREGLRSLNLSNAAAIGMLEALRQNNFAGLSDVGEGLHADASGIAQVTKTAGATTGAVLGTPTDSELAAHALHVQGSSE
ncbi:MAG: tRNA (cytidine(34)-2'-O)-methyltransferase [Eggerthellaceae bacterium]